MEKVNKMTQIDTSKWGKFKVGDLFETFHGERLKKSDRIEGSTPFVTAGSENQGVADYIVTEKKYSNAITIDMFGNCFYHDGTLFGDDNIYFLISNNISKYSKLFIATIINSTLKEKYSFSHQFRQKDLDTLTINLPSTPDNFPDWQYMENYMKEITKLATKRVEKLKEEKTKYKIDTKGWGKFRVGDLFTVYLGDYNNPKFLTEDENGIPLVSATAINNGISGYYKKTPDLKVITKNKITWGKQCPYFYYQTTDFITGQGTYYLDVSALSFYTSLFICAVLNNEISQKYDYNNCLIGKKLSEEIILLPIITKGSPDWQFMEDYMKNIMEQAKKKFSDISQ